MSPKPIAIVGSMHTCPMVNGTVPHVGGPIVQGSANVMANKMQVATIGSICTCAGPPDTIIAGNPTVLVNGMPIACLGDSTAHGGVIATGSPNVVIAGTASGAPQTTLAREVVPFLKITKKDKILAAVSGNSDKLKEAEKNQDEIKKRGYLIDIEFSI